MTLSEIRAADPRWATKSDAEIIARAKEKNIKIDPEPAPAPNGNGGAQADVAAGARVLAERNAKPHVWEQYAKDHGLDVEEVRRMSKLSTGWLNPSAVVSNIPIVGGALDELNAGLATGFGYLGDYNKALATGRAVQMAQEEAYPTLSAAESVVGSGLVGAPVAAPAAAIAAGSRLLPNIAKGAAIGGTLGAEEAFTRGEGSVEDRLAAARRGILPGVAFGTAAPLVAKGIGAGWNVLTRKLQERGIDAQASQRVIRTLDAAGMTPAQASQRLDELGPQGMIADLPGMQAPTGGVATLDPGATRMVTGRLQERLEAAPQRVRQDVEGLLGPARDPYTTEQATKAAQQATGPAYDIAAQHEVDITPAVDIISSRVQTLNPRGETAALYRRMQDHLIDPNGRPLSNGAQVHDARQWLDEMQQTAIRAGQGRTARAIGEVRNSIDATLKTQIPGFAEADRTFASLARQQEAFEQGRTGVFKGGPETMTPAEHADIMSRSSAPENAMRLQGMRAELERTLANERGDPGLRIDRMLGRDFNRAKLEQAVGPQRAAALQQMAEREGTFTQTSNIAQLNRGSRTTPLAEAAAQMFPESRGGGAVRDMLAAAIAPTAFGQPAAAAGAATMVGLSHLARRVRTGQMSAQTAGIIRDVADKLTQTGPQRDFLMISLSRIADRMTSRQETAANLERWARTILIAKAGQAGPAIAAQGPTAMNLLQ
jgi:hypothetical protein